MSLKSMESGKWQMTGFEGSVSHSGGGPLWHINHLKSFLCAKPEFKMKNPWHTNHRKLRSCATPLLIPEENEQQFSAETGKEQKKLTFFG